MEAVGQLAGGVAHDLSNLMTAMFGWLEVASSQLPPDHAARHALKMVERAAHQATGLTRSLLTFSHRAPAQIRQMSLNDAVQDAARLLGRLLPASVELRARVPDDSLWIDGDPTQIHQVVMNLALNARDAMSGEGIIETTLETLNGSRLTVPQAARFEGGTAVLRVRDTGCGIPAKLRSRIFEPFFTTKERERGTGLGLAIVHAIVTSHGGVIGLDSTEDQGSTFSIYLPLKPSVSRKATPAPLAQRARARNIGVLLVEDNPLVRAMMTTVLTDAGYRVCEADDGAKGVAMLESGEPINVAIVDIDLPRVSGLMVLECLHKTSPDVAAIAITGHPLSTDDERHLLELGVRLLQKPFSIHELQGLITTLAKGVRSEP